MSWLNLLAIALALAMDAFAVALATGLALNPLTARHIFRLAFHFGLFQALMPLIGWSLGLFVQELVAGVDHWVAFGLLVFVGGKMLFEAGHEQRAKRKPRDPTRGWDLVLLSVATSIDAFAVGLSLAMLKTTIVLPVFVIGVVAGTLTWWGMLLGRRVGTFWGKGVEVFGGLILCGIGVKIMLEHILH